MKNNFLTHKFLPVLSVFLLVISLFCTSVFAISDVSNYSFYNSLIEKNVTIDEELLVDIFNFVPDDYNNILVIYTKIDNIDYYSFYFSSYPIAISSSSGRLQYAFKNGYYKYIVNSEKINKCDLEYFDLNTSTIQGFQNYSNDNGIYTSVYSSFNDDTVCVYSNHDVYYYNPSDKTVDLETVVFQGAPQEQEVTQVELMKPIQVQEIPQQIAGILAIALPIFLVIFGVLLLLYLLKSKNLLNQ